MIRSKGSYEETLILKEKEHSTIYRRMVRVEMNEKNHIYDIVVVGGGISGAISAIAAARLGADVLVVEQYGFMGGMLTCAGVGPMMTFHAGDRQLIKGIVSEIVDRLVDKGLSPGHIEDAGGYTYTNTPVSAEGMKRELDIMLLEAGGKVLYHTMLADVKVDNKIIQYITVCNKKGLSDIHSKVFIDATGDGDLFAKAGVPYTKGRELDGKCQPMTLNMKVGNVDREELKNYMLDNQDRIKNKRVIETLDTLPRLFLCLYAKEIQEEKAKGGLPLHQKGNVLFFETDVPGEAVLNTTRILNCDPEDPDSISKAEIEGRAQAEEMMNFLKKQRGFENCYLEVTGPRIGVRSSRQLNGLYTLTADDLKESKKFHDTIAHGSYPIDIHSPDGMKTTSFFLKPGQYYNIPYSSLLNDTVHNLITVGRCISATFEAQASIRVTPIAGSIGQAGGTAAYLCSKQGKLPVELDVKELQRLLIDNDMVLIYE